MTLAAVDRLFNQRRVPDLVYVVDNGSGDESATLLRGGLPPHVTLLESERNLGFGAGCNLAIEPALAAGCSHIWLLNNDAVPERECLAALLRAADAAVQPLGAVGSLLIDPENEEAPHFGSWMHPAKMSCSGVSDQRGLQRRYAWCTAASLLVSAEALKTIGAFDDGYFMYWEDADLNLRLRDAGFSLACAPDARVFHHAGTSSATMKTQRYLWHFASQRRFLDQHHPHPVLARVALRAKFLLKALLDADWPRLRAIAVHQ